MEVILKQDVDKLGKSGDIINVKSGYARNYLVPAGIALLASAQAKAQVAAEGRARAKEQTRQKEDAQKLAQRLSSISCTIPVKVGADEQLFGSVTTADIAKAIEEEGISLDRKMVLLDEPIKAIGIYQVPIKLHPEVTAAVKIWIVKE